MGTNYEMIWREYNVCPYCNCEIDSELRSVHLGKSSGGWAFTLRQDPDLDLWDWSGYRAFAMQRNAWFESEDGDELNVDQMQSVVFREDREAPNAGWKHLLHTEGAVSRHLSLPIDYVQGEFS